MPVLTVKEVAAAAGKDTKTLRLWCERGLVPGADRAAAGRHWKIRGTSAAVVAAEAHKRAKGFARRRLTKTQTAFRDLQRMGKRIAKAEKAIKGNFGLSRRHRFAMKYLSLIAATLVEKSKEELEALGLSETFVDRLAWEPVTSPKGLIASLTVWMVESKDQSKTSVARCAGLPRRTLLRRFGRYWPAAKIACDNFIGSYPRSVGAWQKQGEDRRSGTSIHSKVEAAMPAGLAAIGALQKFEGALRNEARSRKPPKC